jgi:aqualysin 1
VTRQAIAIDAQMQGGSWGLARHIRRAAPWLAPGRIISPISTFFECRRNGAGVDVYVVDTGLRYSHQEFGGRGVAVGGVYGSGAVDDNGHGTEIAGMIGGATAGFARAASLRIVKGLNADNTANTPGDIAAAIDIARTDYLARSGTGRPAVLNLSLTASTDAVDAPVQACIEAGMVVVSIAGNSRSSSVPYPGQSEDVICVGGIRANDTPYYIARSGTNWGARVDVLAAAELVWTAGMDADDHYRPVTGTSAAAALTSGAIACMLQGRSRLTSRFGVQLLKSEFLAAATTGRLVPQPHHGIGSLPDRILYLDPRS